MEETLVRYIHFASIMLVTSSLVVEHILLAAQVSITKMRKIALLDAVYGISAITTLLAGLTLWFWVGKPADFYSSNPVFQAKVAVFVLISLLSIYPTLFFIKSRTTGLDSIMVPKNRGSS